MKERKLVYLEWVDSRGATASWEHMEILAENGVCVVKSVGWILCDEKEFIQIVPHVSSDPDQGCGDMTIPKSQISRIVTLAIPSAKSGKSPPGIKP